MKKIRQNHELPSLALIAFVFLLSTGIALLCHIPVQAVAAGFDFSVLVIMITMELFTNLVASTGIMEHLAVRLAVASGGKKKLILFLFGLTMMLISAFFNNITAIMIILPVVFTLMKALDTDERYMGVFFGVLLAASNTGGASSSIGDFPALLIMGSGITSFTGYLFRAFPLFLITTLTLLIFWNFRVKAKNENKERQRFAVDMLSSRYRYAKVRYDVLIPLLLILLCMFLCWSFVPPEVLPSALVAVLGYCAGMIVTALRGVRIRMAVDMKSVLLISSFLFMANVVSASGILVRLAAYLQSTITDPKMLLIIIMLITSLVSGLVSAGPATAAMLPVIVNLCGTAFARNADWVAVAFASGICAGSSLFLWSATAGFILSGRIGEAGLQSNGKPWKWGITEYLHSGVINYLIQITIAILWICIVL